MKDRIIRVSKDDDATIYIVGSGEATEAHFVGWDPPADGSVLALFEVKARRKAIERAVEEMQKRGAQ